MSVFCFFFLVHVSEKERHPGIKQNSLYHLGSAHLYASYLIIFYILYCRFYFDFSPTYVGCGLICPHIVNCSVLLGAIISWGFLWPFITTKAGDWYPDNLGSNDFKGLYGYKVQHSSSVFYLNIIPSASHLLISCGIL